ncbi:MAG: metal ABC transporter substrate-binding protein [Eubacterium sp.]|nr:metal ABC transporter substrate-binding protein [Eubacterium sp.]
MKNFIKMMLSFALVCSLLVGCGAAGDGKAGSASGSAVAGDGKISVVTTIFPEYDWVRQIVGENSNVDLTLLLDDGVDLHSFQPTADDIVKIASCDVFIYVGGESDGWVEDALAEAVNPNMKVINLMEVLGDTVKEEEVVEGMEHEHEHEAEEAEEHEHEHEGEEAEEHEHEAEEAEEHEYDEHVWLSLRNTATLVTKISEDLQAVDQANAESYKKNTETYLASIKELDQKYEDTVKAAEKKTLLFGDRFPFRYMVEDYDLDYFAAFTGCSAESEAAFETITFLAGKVDELGLSAIMQIETADGKLAETVKENTKTKDQEILTLDSLQSTTQSDVDSGKTYMSAMEKNLEVLKKALS